MSISPGSRVRIRLAGAGVATTTKPFTLVVGKTYKVTDRTLLPWDRNVTPIISDDSGVVASSNYNINYLTGVVIFVSTFTVTGSVTGDFTYKPGSLMGWVSEAEMTEENTLENLTTFKTAKTDIDAGDPASKRKQAQLIQITGSLTGFYDHAENLFTVLKSGENLILEFQADVNDATDIEYVEAKLGTGNKGFDVENPNTASVSFESTEAIEYEPA